MSPLSVLAWLDAMRGTPGLTCAARFVALAIALHINGDSGCWRISVSQLCRETGLQERAVRLALRSLQDTGLLGVTHATGRASAYRLLTPRTAPTAAPLEDTPATPDPCTYMHPPPAPTCTPPLHVRAPITSEVTSEATRGVQPAPSGTCCAPSGESAIKREDADPKPAAAKPSTARTIPADWQPNADSRAWIEAQGVSVEEAQPAVIEFRSWASDTGVKRACWDRTFRNNGPVKSALRRVKMDRQRPPQASKAPPPGYRPWFQPEPAGAAYRPFTFD